MARETWEKWLRACLRDPSNPARIALFRDGLPTLGALTGQDKRALDAISACWELYSSSDQAGESARGVSSGPREGRSVDSGGGMTARGQLKTGGLLGSHGVERYPFDPLLRPESVDGLDRLRCISDRRYAATLYEIHMLAERNEAEIGRDQELLARVVEKESAFGNVYANSLAEYLRALLDQRLRSLPFVLLRIARATYAKTTARSPSSVACLRSSGRFD